MPTRLGDHLSQLRREHGMSQEALAQTLDVSRQAISKWERGECAPDTENLIALARLYDVSLDDLVGIESPGQARQSRADKVDERRRRRVLVLVVAVVIVSCAFAPLALSALAGLSVNALAKSAISSGGWTLETPAEWRVTMYEGADGMPSWSLRRGSSGATITVVPRREQAAPERTARAMFDSLSTEKPILRRSQRLGQFDGVTIESPDEGVWVFAGDNGVYGLTAAASSPERFGSTVRVVRKSISRVRHSDE